MRAGFMRVMSRPAKATFPRRLVRPMTESSRVDLPAPLGPTTAMIRPASTSSETPCSAWARP